MADKPADSPPPKSKKLLLIVIVLVVVLALAAGGAFFYISKQRAAAAEEGDHEPAAAAHADPKGAPTYLPLDNMVVNLADPGGEKVAQIGITFELLDAKSSELVKQYLPTIRSSVLLLISQRTAEELLQREGKEKLAQAILREAGRPFGVVDDEETEQDKSAAPSTKKPKVTKKAKARPQSPVTAVLFSSFIVQ